MGYGNAPTVTVGRGCSMVRGRTILQGTGAISEANFYL